eukprot:CAMPEP_0202372684 /NCGR_PEP_ID=MMETSP1127-20130417/3844_1 /ASSEMBLY_ACC=CAM_ASM_000462 /TAXON_ID=3047 /ORGANISM="Dunaliella tertiolecta, Strain CCMP1320" /LENGTH=48 /DNA_ID= /DNA_START= /DNA_END= /DNA_ORIENTATION=
MTECLPGAEDSWSGGASLEAQDQGAAGLKARQSAPQVQGTAGLEARLL